MTNKEKNAGKLEGVMAKGYGLIPKLIMKDKDLTIESKAIYAYLSSYTGAGETAYPSVSLMCSDLGISKDRFYRHRKKLIEKDYIRVSQHQNDEGWTNNIYTVVSIPCPQNKDTRNKDTQNTDTRNKVTNNNSSINNSINNNSNKEHPSAELTNNFEKLWKLYPNKKGKKKALSSYKRAIKNGVTNKEIQEGINRYKEHLDQNEWLKPAHGSTWFNQERWHDDYKTDEVVKDTDNNLESMFEEVNGG